MKILKEKLPFILYSICHTSEFELKIKKLLYYIKAKPNIQIVDLKQFFRLASNMLSSLISFQVKGKMADADCKSSLAEE